MKKRITLKKVNDQYILSLNGEPVSISKYLRVALTLAWAYYK